MNASNRYAPSRILAMAMALTGVLAIATAQAFSPSPVKLNPPLVSGGNVQKIHSVSPDSATVVYLADQNSDNVTELYSVAADGTTSAVRLNIPLSGDRDVVQAAITPNGSAVVYVTLGKVNGTDTYELYRVPTDGSAPALQFNPPVSASGSNYEYDFRISPDGSYVVFRADLDSASTFELYSVPTDGTTPAVKLNAPLVAGGTVKHFKQQFEISSDSSTVVYIADQEVDQSFELYSVPIDGSGAPQKLNHVVSQNLQSVIQFRISQDGSRVAYTMFNDGSGVLPKNLFVVPINASSPPTSVHTIPASPNVMRYFEFSADNTNVVYETVHVQDGSGSLYRAAADGSSSPILLSGDIFHDNYDNQSFLLSPDGATALFIRKNTDGNKTLYSTPIIGNLATSILALGDGPYVSVETLFPGNLKITSDSKTVVYRSDQNNLGDYELYSAPIDGSAAAVKLNQPLAIDGQVENFILSPNGKYVAYTAHLFSKDPGELFRTNVSGQSATTYEINAPLAVGGKVHQYIFSPDSETIFYRADQDITELVELYAWQRNNIPEVQLIWPEYWFWWFEFISPGPYERFTARDLISKTLPFERYGADWMVLSVDASGERFRVLSYDEPLRRGGEYVVASYKLDNLHSLRAVPRDQLQLFDRPERWKTADIPLAKSLLTQTADRRKKAY